MTSTATTDTTARKVEKTMTDETSRLAGGTQGVDDCEAVGRGSDDGRPPARAASPRPRRRALRGRIAAVSVGVAAMLGLVAHMQVTDGRLRSADPAPSPSLAAQNSSKSAQAVAAAGYKRSAAAKARRPIVLTPRSVVHTVTVAGAGGSGGGTAGSGYSSAPAPAAAAPAPVVSSGGSR